jgi:hypothetical protein
MSSIVQASYAGLVARELRRASGCLRIVQRPHENRKAATTKVNAVRTPDSPTHNAAPAPVVAESYAPTMMLFQAAWTTIAGQTLPVSSLMRPIT